MGRRLTTQRQSSTAQQLAVNGLWFMKHRLRVRAHISSLYQCQPPDTCVKS